MKETLTKLIKDARVITLLIFVILAIVAINPQFDTDGVAIRSTTLNSSAALAGIENPKPTAALTKREVIVAINNLPVRNMQDYEEITSQLQPEQEVTLQTDKAIYVLETKPLTETVGYENKTVEETVEEQVEVVLANGTVVNQTQNITKNITKEIPLFEVVGTQDLGLTVSEKPSSNIRKGLDLQGGTRVLLQPEIEVSEEDMEMILSNMKERLNVYGLSDVVVRESGDLSGHQYILVEIAGANEGEVKDLLAKQGKFEAKIGNTTVFKGGSDITYVCRSADCSGIDPRTGCGQSNGGWFCGFQFSIALTPEAAQRQADATAKLDIIRDEQGDAVLSDNIVFYLDDTQVDSLQIGAELRGRASTEISIRGSGQGISEQDARINTLEDMKRQQTVLTTGSLPVKMNLVKTDNLSANLGGQFVKNAFMIGIGALLAVCLVVFIRYRTWKVAVPMLITSFCELTLIFGLAALIGWNLDLAAIAGIIIAIGTGVDHQIVITDETLKSKTEYKENWKRKFKKALFIIMIAYATTLAALIPLLSAGAGLLKGFALTTIMGVSFGVFITRPAYAAILKILLNE